MTQTMVLVGVPGAGKTETAIRIASKIQDRGFSIWQLGFSSFTRAARREAAARASAAFGIPVEELEKQGWFRTMHSCCAKQLGLEKGQIVNNDIRWLKDTLEGQAVGATTDIDAEEAWTNQWKGKSPAAIALGLWDVARNRMVPLSEVVVDHQRRLGGVVGAIAVIEAEHYVLLYEEAKRRDSRLDFSDLILRFAGVNMGIRGPEFVRPEGEIPPVPVWIFDEAQDTSPLLDRAARRMASESVYVYLMGDRDQCQPEGTMVLTTNGYKAIEDLDEERDRLVSWDRNSSIVCGFRKGLRFKKAVRPGYGPLLTIQASGKVTRCTQEHKWPVRLLPNRLGWCVYLMRRGDWFRIGKTQLYLQGNAQQRHSLAVLRRCTSEKADSVWILKVVENNGEALALEQILSIRYGIPTCCFEDHTAQKNGGVRNAAYIQMIYDSLNPVAQMRKARQCCESFGRDLDFPLWSRKRDDKNFFCGRRTSWTVASCNLIPEIMEIPVYDGSVLVNSKKWRGKKQGYDWSSFSVTRDETPAEESFPPHDVRKAPHLLYSLEVECYHYYIADGIISHNSIYEWAGADGGLFLNWPCDRKEYLSKSWRCAREIMELGRRLIIQNHPTDSQFRVLAISPRCEGGQVERNYGANVANVLRDPTVQTLFMARTNEQCKIFQEVLSASNIPWKSLKSAARWPAETSIKLSQAFLDLREGKEIDGDAWRRIVKKVPVDLLERGTKAFYAPAASKHEVRGCRLETIVAHGAVPTLADKIKTGQWVDLLDEEEKKVHEARRRWGAVALDPAVVISTIHGAKGMTADRVVLSTEITKAIEENIRTHEGATEERRVWYVAATRARDHLVLLESGSRNYAGIYDAWAPT